MSFLLDPPLLLATGAALEHLADDDTADRLETLTTAVFYGVSVPLWLDSDARPLRLFWRPFGSEGGRDFMINSGVLDLPVPERPTARHHLLAAGIFATYPLFLRLGRVLGRRWRRRAAGSGPGTSG